MVRFIETNPPIFACLDCQQKTTEGYCNLSENNNLQLLLPILNDEELSDVIEKSVSGISYDCLKCRVAIDPDQDYCIECGLMNPLPLYKVI